MKQALENADATFRVSTTAPPEIVDIDAEVRAGRMSVQEALDRLDGLCPRTIVDGPGGPGV